MKFHVSRMVLFGLFAFAAMGSASATQIKTPTPALATEVAAVQAPERVALNPWPTVASIAEKRNGTLLAHDDRYWHDHRDDWRRENWRRDQWRREQARREADRRRDWEHRRDWERRHDRAMRYRYENDHRYYRR
jgi:hypothetical protein